MITTSFDGLSQTTEQDEAGNGTISRTRTDVTVVNLDGSKTETITDLNGDDTSSQEAVVSTSADGRTTRSELQSQGEGFFGHTEVTTVSADGGTSTSKDVNASGKMLDETVTTISADRRSKTVKTNSTGNDVFDSVATSATNADGSISTTILDYNSDGSVKDRAVTTLSADGSTKVSPDRYE